MTRNIYNIRLQNGIELISEIISIEELQELSVEAADLFTEGDTILAHPIIVHTNLYYDSSEGMSGIDNVYAPFLTHAKHGCVAILSDTIQVIDDIHEDMIDQYIETVIAVYGHLYDETVELPPPPSTSTIH